MRRDNSPLESGDADDAFQGRILPFVSRTFALTIPTLPPALRDVVTNAYLLCRIADTIEDEPAISAEESLVYLQRFSAVVHGTADAAALARELGPKLSERTLPQERELVREMERLIRLTMRYGEHEQAAIRRCIDVMCFGMHHFQRVTSLRGLPTSGDLDRYCYYVAGVVGEMLTELFCGYSPAIARRRTELHELAGSFGRGLQMTNILKDIWEDRGRGVCWLPRDVFERHGIDLAELAPGNDDGRFGAALQELIGVAHAHLRDAFDFSLLIPAEEAGIRRFCLWAIGLAILTLRRIADNPAFSAGAQVKISRSAVASTCTLTNLAVRHDWMLKRMFARITRGLPLTPPCDTQGAARTAAAGEHKADHLADRNRGVVAPAPLDARTPEGTRVRPV